MFFSRSILRRLDLWARASVVHLLDLEQCQHPMQPRSLCPTCHLFSVFHSTAAFVFSARLLLYFYRLKPKAALYRYDIMSKSDPLLLKYKLSDTLPPELRWPGHRSSLPSTKSPNQFQLLQRFTTHEILATSKAITYTTEAQNRSQCE